MASYDVESRSAIVTGAGSGIGRAVALEFAANGAAVIVAEMNAEHAQAVVDESGRPVARPRRSSAMSSTPVSMRPVSPTRTRWHPCASR